MALKILPLSQTKMFALCIHIYDDRILMAVKMRKQMVSWKERCRHQAQHQP